MARRVFGCALVLSMAAVAAEGHHSIAGVYDSTQPVTIEGTVAQFEYVNPHPYMFVEVRRGTATERWHLEMDNRFELADIGITESTFKAGDRIVVTGSPARREPRKMYIERLDRPADGFGFEQVGNRPRLRKR